MIRNDITHLPTFYEGYVQEAPDMPLIAALWHSREILSRQLEEDLLAIGNKVYAPGKWTVPVVLQHIIDTERIMTYRALRFARKDKTELPGFDENAYADTTADNNRTVTDLLRELRTVRAATIQMFESFGEETLASFGPANGNDISVGALGYIIAGHQAHHLSVIAERYMPLVKEAASLN